mgnify:CR=1 FL=1
MQENTATDSPPAPQTYLNVHNAMLGVHGKDLYSTLRTLAFQGLRQPLHSARHALALGGQLSRVLLGDTLYPLDPNDLRFSDPTWRLNPFYRRSLQAYLAWQHQLQQWVEFETWERRGDGTTVIRLMTSWATPESAIEAFAVTFCAIYTEVRAAAAASQAQGA